MKTAVAAREEMLNRIAALDLPELARMTAHEYDEDVMVPAEGSQGAAFLRDAQLCYVAWVQREGRFPNDNEADEAAAWWHHADSVGSQRVQAFVDLGLYFSYHANVAQGATPAELYKVLDEAAEQFVITLTSEYGPLPG